MNRFAFVAFYSVTVASLAAQQSDSLRFEVASVKARTADDRTAFRVAFEPGGRFITVNAPLTFWIGQVYPTQTGQIDGRPPWLGTQGFDINAKAAGEPSREQTLEMLRSLLRDRFKLAVHYEMRDEDAWALRRVNSDRLGPNLRPINVDCTARAAAVARGETPPALPPASNGLAACRTSSPVGNLKSGGISIADLTRMLRHDARAVIDKTGLSGHFEMELTYFNGPPEQRGLNDPVDIYTAVREQLGLRLDRERNPVRVLIIDRIELPTPD